MAKLDDIVSVDRALEIGGPSELYEKVVPIYEKIKNIEFVNRYASTITHYGKKYHMGSAEITNLPHPSGTFDMVLASHVLEHTTNPIRGFMEIWRVLKVGGLALLILPKKEFMIDKYRPTTTYDHIMWDFKLNTPEEDLRHLDEIVNMYAFEHDKTVKNKEELRARCMRSDWRTMHQHVFDEPLIEKVAKFCEFTHVETWFELPWNIVSLLRKDKEPFQDTNGT